MFRLLQAVRVYLVFFPLNLFSNLKLHFTLFPFRIFQKEAGTATIAFVKAVGMLLKYQKRILGLCLCWNVHNVTINVSSFSAYHFLTNLRFSLCWGVGGVNQIVLFLYEWCFSEFWQPVLVTYFYCILNFFCLHFIVFKRFFVSFPDHYICIKKTDPSIEVKSGSWFCGENCEQVILSF